MGSKRPQCSINYASVACLITWSTRRANEPRPDLLIIKMQSNLLPVCCAYWTWRGCSHSACGLLLPNLRWINLLYQCDFGYFLSLYVWNGWELNHAWSLCRLFRVMLKGCFFPRQEATSSLSAASGLESLLTFLSVISEAIHSSSHLYFTAGPLDPNNNLAKQNNHFNNQRTEVWGQRAANIRSIIRQLK